MIRIVMLAAALFAPFRAEAAPCIAAAARCAEWVGLGRSSARALVYRSFSLDARNESIRRALIVVHGTDRNAQAEYAAALAAAGIAHALDDTIVVAPRFASNNGLVAGCADRLAPREVNWPCDGTSWRAGGAASDGTLTSFDFADEILRRLATRDRFPNLKAIVVAGHSAGGQFVTRYEMANQVHDSLGVPVTYVVANPSSYAYPDAARPAPARACVNYNTWPYGLENRRGYAARESASQLTKQLVARPTTYLLGEQDVLPNVGFDASCAAMAQGATRLARGEAYAALMRKLGARHTVTVVPRCGHEVRCMYTANAALPVLFPKAR
jgi:hypothetical protein